MDKITINSKERILIIYVLLAAVTLAVFWPVNQYGFVYDDVVYVTQNRNIQSGITLDGMRWAFSTRYADLWHPLTWLSLMLDYEFYGLHAGGYHVTNLTLHILSTLLLFWLFHRMTGALWRSAFVAAFFALHPLHVESVAWVSERKDVLSAFFWMLTLCLYVFYTEKQSIKRYLLVVFSFVLALLSKPMVVTLPLIMILLDFWPLKRFENQNRLSDMIVWQLREKLPLIVLSAVLVAFTLYIPNEQQTFEKSFSVMSRLANAPVAFVTYLVKTFWPHAMAAFYPFPAQILLWQSIGAFLLIIVITLAVAVTIKRLPFLIVGWAWYAIVITPVIGIIQISAYPYAMADRYHYLPSIGLAVMFAWGIPLLMKNRQTGKKILFPAGAVFFSGLAFLSWNQCSYWENSAILWKHALEVTENNYRAHGNLGLARFDEGEYDQALDHYNKAVSIEPDDVYSYNNRGIIYGKRGEYQQAIDDFNHALRIVPSFANAYNNRGYSYYKLGQYPRAIEDYGQAIRFKPDYAEAYVNRGVLYLKQKHIMPGCHDLRKACALGNCRTWESAKGMGLCR